MSVGQMGTGQPSHDHYSTGHQRETAAVPGQIRAFRRQTGPWIFRLELGQLLPPATATRTSPTNATIETTMAVILGSGERGSGEPWRMLRSLAFQLERLITEIATPRAMSG